MHQIERIQTELADGLYEMELDHSEMVMDTVQARTALEEWRRTPVSNLATFPVPAWASFWREECMSSPPPSITTAEESNP